MKVLWKLWELLPTCNFCLQLLSEFSGLQLNQNPWVWDLIYCFLNAIPLAPMGALAPGSAHARPSVQAPIDTSIHFSVQLSGGGGLAKKLKITFPKVENFC